jgi:hypothetical protein
VGKDDELHAVACVELGLDVRDVSLDRRLLDAEAASDLGVRGGHRDRKDSQRVAGDARQDCTAKPLLERQT